MIKTLSHISLSTKNLENPKKFYVKILGFKIIHKFLDKNKKEYGFFLKCGNKTFLEFFKSKTKPKIINTNLRHICFQVSNIKKIKILIEKKLKRKIKIKRGRTDNVLLFFTEDLDKNLVEFQQHDKKSKLKKYFI